MIQSLRIIRRSPIIAESPQPRRSESAFSARIKRSFSTQFANTGHSSKTCQTGQFDPKRKFFCFTSQVGLAQLPAVPMLAGNGSSRSQ
jgi:hypothetical protein